MADTPRIRLPLLDAAQAQKHVTVNEALARLDVVAAARVETMMLTAPPGTPADGEAHLVATGAAGAWSGQDGKLAVFLNGGWEFMTPWAGWRLWVAAESGVAVHDGAGWRLVQQLVSPGGALSAVRQAEINHAVGSGATSETAAFIPDKAIVLGVTGRVIEAIPGATGWSLGVAGSPDRYGSGLGVAQNSFAHGVTGSPLAYFGGSALLLTAEGGSFAGGTVRLVAHYLELAPPRAV